MSLTTENIVVIVEGYFLGLIPVCYIKWATSLEVTFSFSHRRMENIRETTHSGGCGFGLEW